MKSKQLCMCIAVTLWPENIGGPPYACPRPVCVTAAQVVRSAFSGRNKTWSLPPHPIDVHSYLAKGQEVSAGQVLRGGLAI